LSAWRKVLTTLPKDPNDWRGASAALKKVEDEIEADRSPTNILNVILFPAFDAVPNAIARQIANRRIIATAIRLMRIRVETGRLPSVLPNFGETSTDPFNGKSLRYKREGTGFRIYSIDSDLTDNGGTLKKSGTQGDLVRTFK
jgi:hypothetical protein